MKRPHRFTIGIDIGKTAGAFAIQEAGEIKTFGMPKIGTELDYQEIYKILEPYEAGNGMVVFEKLQPIFGSSKQTAFSMGFQAGAIEMACVALCIPFTKIPPKRWQETMFLGIENITHKVKGKDKRDTKAMALMAVKRRFPTLKLTFGTVAKVPHDGLVDAVLMSEFAKNI